MTKPSKTLVVKRNFWTSIGERKWISTLSLSDR